MKMRVSQVCRYITAVIHMTVLFIVTVLVVWVADNRPAVRYLEASTSTPEVHRGDDLILSYKVDMLRDCPRRIYRRLYDDTGLYTQFGSMVVAGEVGEGRLSQVSFRFPVHLPAGEWYYEAMVVSECNPLKSVVDYSPRVKFVAVE